MTQTDRDIKRGLNDASVWLKEAARAWPKHKRVALARIQGAHASIQISLDLAEHVIKSGDSDA